MYVIQPYENINFIFKNSFFKKNKQKKSPVIPTNTLREKSFSRPIRTTKKKTCFRHFHEKVPWHIIFL